MAKKVEVGNAGARVVKQKDPTLNTDSLGEEKKRTKLLVQKVFVANVKGAKSLKK